MTLNCKFTRNIKCNKQVNFDLWITCCGISNDSYENNVRYSEPWKCHRLHFLTVFVFKLWFSHNCQACCHSINNPFAAYILGMLEMCPGYFCHCLRVGGWMSTDFGLTHWCRPVAVALDKLAHKTFHLNLIVSPSDSKASYGPAWHPGRLAGRH